MLCNKVEVIDHTVAKNMQTIGSSLKAGMYVIQVYDSSKPKSFRIIKK